MKHSPGPYEAFVQHQYKKGTMIETELKEINILGPVKDNGGQTYLAKLAIHNMTEDEAIVTGHLMAAAPDMLAELERWVRILEYHHVMKYSAELKETKALIAKAKGES